MNHLNHISVFCASSLGYANIYEKTAEKLGETLAKKAITLVFGGGRVGLMGVTANAVLANGGKVTGVIPSFLKTKEIAHEELTDLIVVQTMHERKTKMNELCDGVITLPGGFGTLDEVFEMLTWAQLGLHRKPIGFLNINGYYDPLFLLLGNMVKEGFLKKENYDLVIQDTDIEPLIHKMEQFKSPEITKWLKQDKEA